MAIGTNPALAALRRNVTGAIERGEAEAVVEQPTSPFDAGTVKCGAKVFSTNYGGELTVVQIGYGKVDAEDVLAGKVGAETVYLSADGYGFTTGEWAADAGGEAVYVEVLRKDGRDFHGWVDASSRKLVQTG